MEFNSLGSSVEADTKLVDRALDIWQASADKNKLVPKDAGDMVYRVANFAVAESVEDSMRIARAKAFFGEVE